MKSIIFVCLGNICRSPIAEGCARSIIKDKKLDIEVDSAGTGDWHIGQPPCSNSIKVTKENGIDISSLRARQITKEDFKKFDLLVALDESNYRDLKKMGANKLVKLGDYGYGGKDVPDPYFFKGFDGFRKVFSMIRDCVEELIDENSK